MLALTEAVTSRLKKISLRLAYIFYDLIVNRILDNLWKLDDYRMYLKKIYTSYVFFLKAKVEVTFSITEDSTIKKMVVVGGIFS